MKKTLRSLSWVMVLAMALSVFTGCAAIDKIKDLLGLGGPVDDGKVTVSWYQGSKLLREDKVDKGTVLTEWVPEVEGKSFQGWFAEASLAQAFDFTKPVEADTDIFAAFKSEVYVEDTNEYYLVGTGAGDMSKSNWNEKDGTLLPMTKQNVENKNVYTITIKMYAGDRFQICYGGSWNGQTGIGKMVGAEYCDGVNEYDKAEYKAADKKVAQVKDADGNVVFVGSDEYNKGFETWNIILANGQDGIYEFTFTTYPESADYNEIAWRLVEKIDPLTATHEMYFRGSFNNWGNDGLAPEWMLSPNEAKTEYTAIHTFAEAVELKVYNNVNGDWIGYNGDNLKLEAGTYAFKYYTESNSFEYQLLDYYIVGTLLDSEGNQVNYAVKAGVSPKLELQEDGSYVATLTTYDATAQYDWMTAQGKTDANGVPAIMSIKVVYGSELGIKDWYSAEGGDNWYLSAGTYTVTLADGAVTIVPAE